MANTNTVICTSDRYTQDREEYASVEEFCAMCEACFGEAPELRRVGDEWHDNEGVVLVEEMKVTNQTAIRVFSGADTNQVDAVTGQRANPELWYWEPADYDGDVLWSDGRRSLEEMRSVVSMLVESGVMRDAFVSDALSIDNGNTVTTVAALTDDQVERVLEAMPQDNELGDTVEAATNREWLAAYCEAYQRAHGELLTIG